MSFQLLICHKSFQLHICMGLLVFGLLQLHLPNTPHDVYFFLYDVTMPLNIHLPFWLLLLVNVFHYNILHFL